MKKTPTTLSLLTGNLWLPRDQAEPTENTVMPPPSITRVQAVTPAAAPVAVINAFQNVAMAPTAATLPSAAVSRVTTASEPPSKASAPLRMQTLISSWPALCNAIKSCQECNLHLGRQNVVIERGNQRADWMFIGEGPGEQEDIHGLPFVGAAGQLLDKMLAAMHLDPAQDVYIANVVKCRPPHNRNPTDEEIDSCRNYLASQIALVQPKIIVALGRIAAASLLNTQVALGKLRGSLHSFNEIPLIATYHPAYLLRTPSAKKDSWQDLQFALQIFSTLRVK